METDHARLEECSFRLLFHSAIHRIQKQRVKQEMRLGLLLVV